MIDYIKGKITVVTPTTVVIDNSGIGYCMEISLQTYALLENKEEATVYIQQQFNPRDGSTVDYGFASKSERELFRLITSVSGMGAASARMILSSMNVEEFKDAILSENLIVLKSIKGIGLKSAQRMILELKDKIVEGGGSTSPEALFSTESNAAVEEATSALVMLGFSKPNIQKALKNILKANPSASVEMLIKSALKSL